ncbi:MAG: hypothetical protein IJQ02_08405 [Oscillospiraceae bacterium]|nr:hypothetical protein [Oscillospiraceae bacterium]
MKKQILSYLMIAVFLLLCLLPSVGILVTGPSAMLANETAPRTPRLQSRDGSLNIGFLSDVTDYMESRFAFRPVFVTARSFLYEKLLRSSAEEQVLLGKNGQLHYSATVDDFCGVGMSDAELRTVAEHLAAIQDTVEAKGSLFVFTVAPNRNSLQPENMPASFRVDHESANFSRLLPMLEEYGVHTVDLHALLNRQNLYYLTDSHWTAEGAAVAADALLAAVGRESRYAAGPFGEDGLHVGDLYQMLYPLGKGREAEIVYTPGFRHETSSNPQGGNAITIRTTCSEGTGSLYCRRDSFGISLYPYLADAFETAEFSRSADYTVEAFSDIEADVVILEIVERNLSSLLAAAAS